MLRSQGPSAKRSVIAAFCAIALVYGSLVARAGRGRAADNNVVADLPCLETGESYFVAAFGEFPIPGLTPSLEKIPSVLMVTDTLQNDPTLQQRIVAWSEVGSVYGLAHDARRHTLYAASHLRYQSLGYGPGGPGTIYAIDLLTGRAAIWAKLEAGPSRWAFARSYDTSPRYIGQTDLGDIEIDQDGRRLMVANLYDRRIHVLSVPEGDHLGAFDHGAAAEPWAANARVFGLGVRGDWLYHSVIDIRALPQLPGEFAAYVYRSRADGSEMELILQFDLDYRKDCTWQPWQSAWDEREPVPCEPMLSDIEFRPNGDPILAFRDRLAGFDLYSRGDILPTRRSGQRWEAVLRPEHYTRTVSTTRAVLRRCMAAWRQLMAQTALRRRRRLCPTAANSRRASCGSTTGTAIQRGRRMVERSCSIVSI